MKHLVAVMLILFCFLSCKKDLSPIKNEYNVEEFRKPGMTDYQTIQAAVDSVPENSHIIFNNKQYNIDHTIFVTKSLNFKGPATLKRADQVVYHLTSPADMNSTVIVLDNTEGLQIRDYFILTHGTSYEENSQANLITKISNDSVFLYYPLGVTVDGLNNYPTGTNFFKDIKFFWILDANAGLYPTQSCTFDGITFDGNRDNNKGTFSWLLNTAILALSKNTTYYSFCTFINSPGESIVGHNADIRYCKFYNLNGSGFHASADRLYNSEEEIHSVLFKNEFENTNEIPNSIGGHDEGAITHSDSGGYYTATYNTFTNVGESVLGNLYPSVSKNDWGTSNITFTNNIIKTTGRLVFYISILPGTIHDVRIENNDIINLKPWDWRTQLAYWPGIVLDNKVNP